jgi:hypothetical protein
VVVVVAAEIGGNSLIRGEWGAPSSRRSPTQSVCRNIKTLYNFEPPATGDEVRAASLQFVRKLSGFNKPSRANLPAFELAVDQVAEVAQELLDALVTSSPPRDRAVEAERARARAAQRFGTAPAA